MSTRVLSEKDRTERILEVLADLGSGTTKHEDIVQRGQQLVVPENMTLHQCVKFLIRKIEQEEEPTVFARKFKYRPWDGAFCMFEAFKTVFGAVSHMSQTIQTMFGPVEVPPQIIDVKVAPDETVRVPWGEFTLPFLPDCKVETSGYEDPDFGACFQMKVTGPQKYRDHIEGLFELVAAKLQTESIYRGKAIDGQEMPDFLDLSGVDESKIIYTDDVESQLETNILSPIRYTQTMRDVNLPLKRAVLMHGPYGTGKTLAAFKTFKVAVENGWTSIYCRPGKDNMYEVMQTARLYQPSVVFFEDIDTISDTQDADADSITTLLDMFDGIVAKGTEILVVLTTNHPQKIHKGMIRPGRLDAVIKIDALDEGGIERMIQSLIPEEHLDENIDYNLVARAFEGYLPAYVKEGADRALRYALTRKKGVKDNLVLETEDFVLAGDGLRAQLELQESAKEHSPRESVGANLERLVEKVVSRAVVVPDDYTPEKPWGKLEVVEADPTA